MTYIYTLVGESYHTRECPAVTAYDSLTRTAATKSDVPEGRSKCGHCERIEGGIRYG